MVLTSLRSFLSVSSLCFNNIEQFNIDLSNLLSCETNLNYNTFYLLKKNNSRRRIDAPKPFLYKIQKILADDFLTNFPIHSAALGYIKGKSIIDNARLHTNKQILINIDLKDFYPSITSDRFCSIVSKYYLIETNVIEEIKKIFFIKNNNQFVLPQGAPSSPVISNIVCYDLDHELSILAKKYHFTYSRYCDDLSFSSNTIKYIEAFKIELNELIIKNGFNVNIEKYREQSAFYKQVVTGITVNKILNVDRSYIKNIRKYLYLWKRYGYQKANFYYNKEQIAKRKEPKLLINSLQGKIDFLGQVKGRDANVYVKYLNVFLCILKKDFKEHGLQNYTLHISSKNQNVTLDRDDVPLSGKNLQFSLSTTSERIQGGTKDFNNEKRPRSGVLKLSDDAILSQFAYSGLVKPGNIIIYRMIVSPNGSSYIVAYAVTPNKKGISTNKDLVFLGSLQENKMQNMNGATTEEKEAYAAFYNSFKENGKPVHNRTFATKILSIGGTTPYMTPKDQVKGVKEVFGQLKSLDGKITVNRADKRIKFATIRTGTDYDLKKALHVVPTGITAKNLINYHTRNGSSFYSGMPVAFIPMVVNGELKYFMYPMRPKNISSIIDSALREYNEKNNSDLKLEDVDAKDVFPKNHPVRRLILDLKTFLEPEKDERSPADAIKNETKKFFRFNFYRHRKVESGENATIQEINSVRDANLVSFSLFKENETNYGVSVYKLNNYVNAVKFVVPQYDENGIKLSKPLIKYLITGANKKTVILADDIKISDSGYSLEGVNGEKEIGGNFNEMLHELLPIIGNMNTTINQHVHKASTKTPYKPKKENLDADDSTSNVMLEDKLYEDIIKYNLFETDIDKNTLVAAQAVSMDANNPMAVPTLFTFNSSLEAFKNNRRKIQEETGSTDNIDFSYTGSSFGFTKPTADTFVDLGVTDENTKFDLVDINNKLNDK